MKGTFCPDFSCTHGRMCVHGRYAPASNLTIHVLQHQFHQGIPDDVADERKLGYSSLRPHATHLLVIQVSVLKGNAWGGAKKMAWKFHCTHKLIKKKK